MGLATDVGSLHDRLSKSTLMGNKPTNNDKSQRVTQLLIECQSTLYSFVYSLLGGSGDAYDVLQEANLAILAKADEYDPSKSFKSWAFKFAHVQVLAHRKRVGRDRLCFDDRLVETLAADFADDESGFSVRLGALSRCIERLAPKHRELLSMCYELGYPQVKIAAMSGRTVASIGMALCRIRRRLFDCIQVTLAKEDAL